MLVIINNLNLLHVHSCTHAALSNAFCAQEPIRRSHLLCHELSVMRLHALEPLRVYSLQVGLQISLCLSLCLCLRTSNSSSNASNIGKGDNAALTTATANTCLA